MKKIIATAVAAAFVGPVMAADITITGFYESAIVSESTAVAAEDDQTNVNQEMALTFKASEELDNGMTVSADWTLDNDGEYFNNSLNISGAFGYVELGATSGAIDGIDDSADPMYVHDNGSNAGTSKDTYASWVLPTMVEGLDVRLSYSPDTNNADITDFDIDHTQGDTAIADDVSGVGLKYSIGGATLRYGQEDVGAVENRLVAATYTVGGLYAAIENTESDQSDGTTNESRQMAATYTMDAVTLKIATKEYDEDSTAVNDITAYGVAYKIGGLTFFAETADDSEADEQITALGASYKF